MKISSKSNLKLTYLINCILIQSFLQIILIVVSHDGLFPGADIPSSWIALALTLNMIIFVLVIFNIQKLRVAATQETIILQQKKSLDRLGKLVETIQQQKHDFVNHLQVMSGLAQLNKFEELKKYVSDITDEVKPQYEFISLSRLELKSLLFVKAGVAKEKSISFNISVRDDFNDFPLCQIASVNLLGNLINNAFTASLNAPKPEVNIFLDLIDDYYIIKIQNNGVPIPEGVGNTIFEKGYTTKKGDGLGLYIVKSYVKRCGGTISYESSSATGTEFTVSIPKGKNQGPK